MQPFQSQMPPQYSRQQTANSGCGSTLVYSLAGFWIMGVTLIIVSIAWGVAQFLMYQETPLPGTVWLAISLGHAVLLAIVVLPLAFLVRVPRYRAVYTTWAIAIAYLALLALPRLLPELWKQPIALTQIILSLVASLILGIVAVRRGYRFRPVGFPLLAVLLAPLVAAPWLAWGALGSWLDTLLDIAAALSLGLFAGILIDSFLIQPLRTHSLDARADGFAAGVTLVILGAGFGFGGSQLLLMIVLPALGYMTVALSRFAERSGKQAWLPVAALVGLVAAAPLALIDPSELSIFTLGQNETSDWAYRAALLSMLIAWVIGGVLSAILSRTSLTLNTRLVGGLAVLAWIGGLLLYFFIGQPGFYGDRLFVILKDQADVSAAANIPDRAQRLHYVYTTLRDHANTSQARLRADLDRLGIQYQPYYLVNGIEVNGDSLVQAYLERQPEVDRILYSPHLRPLPAAVTPMTGDLPAPQKPDWNITMIGADRVWNELHVTGKGIVVGQSDSGVQGDHPALRDTYRGRTGQNDYNWIDPWFHTRVPTDAGGHGTHTLGTVLGHGGIGVAPDAEWIGCVNLGRNLGNPGLYLDCMQFMLAPYPQRGDPLKDGDPSKAADVLNNSWGCPFNEGCDPHTLSVAVRALRAAGIFVVASAGNTGPQCSTIEDPIAIYDSVFSVGAVDESGTVTDFSSRGPVTVDGSGRVKPDIVAPGADVLSSLPGSTYGRESGTSMAGPHVVGVVALMWSANPKLIGDIDTTEQILIQTAKPYSGQRSGCFTGTVPNDAFGYGEVDAYAAVKAALDKK